MKKFISMVMAAAMVVSLVPATAFAADNTCSLKVVKAAEETKVDATAANWGTNMLDADAEIQIVLGDIETTATADAFEIDLDFTGAKMGANAGATTWNGAKVIDASTSIATPIVVDVAAVEAGDTTVTLTVNEDAAINFATGDIIALPVNNNNIAIKSLKEGSKASVEVSGDLGSAEAKVFATVVGQDLKIKAKKVTEIGEEIGTPIANVTIETVVGTVKAGDVVTLKLNKGFEFANKPVIANLTWGTSDDANVLKFTYATDFSKLVLTGLQIEAVSAKPGDVATMKVSVKDWTAASCDVAEVIAAGVKVALVDADLDVPEIYAGTDKDDTALTSDGDHLSLEVKFEETVIDGWDTVKALTMSLPEGVYVTDVIETGIEGFDTFASFEDAYKKGDYTEFEFGRRAFDVTDGAKAEFVLQFELVAEPGFTGDVVLTVAGDGIGTHEVVIAKFVAPYTVEAAQNDVIIDYRNTEVATDVVVKEAEAGLFASDEATTGAEFVFTVEHIDFEDGFKLAVNEESEAKVKDLKSGDHMSFYVDEESNEEAAVVTLNGIELYMYRSLPAGAYDLVLNTSMGEAFMAQQLFGTGAGTIGYEFFDNATAYDEVAKEAWVNIVTAGRDKDDASFTKKVIVPIGESYLIAGEDTVALDVPAYINANDYTMLPVRAVATALGIHNNNVIWSDAAKQVTILYGQRIITMTVGQSVIYVNGSAIPAKAAVEIVDGRAFLGFRDLANALGVVEIDYVDGKAIMN